MIDTIKFSIEKLKTTNVKLYEYLVNNYKSRVHTGTNSRFTFLEREVVIIEDTDYYSENLRVPDVILPSSNYKLRIRADFKKDILSFEFSLPKVFHGHNLAQCVIDPFHSPSFVYQKDKNDNITFHLQDLAKCFKYYLKRYLSLQFPGLSIDYSTLFLERIDICYNQYFPTESLLNTHLKHLKSLTPKGCRENPKRLLPFPTGYFYATDDYSLKIYHKGPEFLKDDSKELKKANKKLDLKDQFDIPFLQNEANKILRYEFMFRAGYLSKLYNNRILRKSDYNGVPLKDYELLGRLYNKLNVLEHKNLLNYESKELKELALQNLKTKITLNTAFGGLTSVGLIRYLISEKKRDLFKMSAEYSILDASKALCYFYDKFSALKDKSRKFYLELSPTDEILYQYDKKTNFNFLKTIENVRLDNDIYNVITCRFLEFLNDFKVEIKDDYGVFKDRLIDFNRKQKQGKDCALTKKEKSSYKEKDITKMLSLYLALETITLKEYKRRIGFSLSTYNRYLKDLNDLGYKKNSLALTYIPNFTYDYYFNFVNFNGFKFFKNSLRYIHTDYNSRLPKFALRA